MKGIYVLLVFLLLAGEIFSQDLAGEWKGSFIDDSRKYSTEDRYKINFYFTKISDSVFQAFSKTFNVSHDSAICILEGGFLEKNILYLKETKAIQPYSADGTTTCFQIMKLYYYKRKNKLMLRGEWNTEGKDCGYGSIILTKKL